MKASFSTAALIVFTLGCAPLPSYACGQRATEARIDTSAHGPIATHDSKHAASAEATPVIRVGVSDPDTQLNLPWFLADVINAVNTRMSACDLLHTLKNDL